MTSSYRKIGDFIQQVNIKNEDGSIELLLGVNLDKVFINSVANTIGTDMTKYKIIKKGQFGCKLMSVGRDKKLPISRLVDYEKAIISSAYYVFEVVDETILSPEYLMMWFSRPESDRYLWFQSGGDVRGRITWNDLCQLPIKVPTIEKQHEIVKEYNTIVNRIKLNETLNQKLEDTAQALYKHWFVDFEFPNAEGKPYKSSGGEMVYNEELDMEIPLGWEVRNIEALCDIIDGDRGKNYPSQQHFSESGYCLFLNAGNVSKIGFNFTNKSFISKERDELLRKGKLNRKDIVLTSRGTVGNIAFYSDLIEFEHLRINSGMVIFRAKVIDYSIFIYSLMRSEQMSRNIENFMSGSAQPQLPIKDIKLIPVLIPNFDLILSFSKSMISIQNHLEILNKENRKLLNLKDLLLSKMSKVETKTAVV